MKSNFLTLAASLMLLASCTGGTSTSRKVHEAANMSPLSVESSATAKQNDQQVEALKSVAKIQDPQDILNKGSEKFFDMKNWQDLTLNRTTEFVHFIDQVMQSAVELQKSQTAKSSNVAWWSQFQILADKFCDDNLTHCELMIPLKGTTWASQALTVLADQQTDLNKKYKYLYMAFDIQNQIFANSTVESFLKNAKAYKEFLKNEKSQIDRSSQSNKLEANAKNQDKLDKMLNFLVELYQQGKVKISDTSWIAGLNLLNTKNQNDVSLAAKFTVYEDQQRTQLTSEFKAEIQKNQKRPGSFTEKVNWIKVASPSLLSDLKINELNIDEYFYTIDQIYTSRWTAQQSANFAKSGQFDTQKLSLVAQNYLRTQVAFLMALAQSEMKSFVNDSATFDSAKLFTFASKYLSRSTVEARALPEKAQSISQVFSLIEGSRGQQAAILLAQTNQLQKTLKISLTYPNTMAVIYMATRAGLSTDARLEVSKFSAQGNFSLLKYVESLFNGQMFPIFDYTADIDPISAFELTESLEIAARTRFFESLGLSTDSVLSTLFDLRFKSKIKLLDSNLANLTEKYNSPEWENLLQFCESVKANDMQSMQKSQRTLSIKDLRSSPTLGSAEDRLNDPYRATEGNTVGGVNFVKRGYFAYSGRLNDQLEQIRIDLFYNLNYFESIQKVISTNTSIQLPLLKQRIENVKSKAKEFAVTFSQRIHEGSDCYFTLMQRDRKIITQIVSYEAAYWKSVYQLLKSQKQPSTTQIMNLGYQLPSEIKYRTQINTGAVVSYQFDFLLRVKGYLENGLTISTTHFPALDPSLTIDLSNALASDSLYRETNVSQIPLLGSETEFVKSAVTAQGLLSSKNTLVFWFLESYIQFYNFRDYQDGLALFYRIAPQLKSILGLDAPFSADDLVKSNDQLVEFMNLTNEEKQAFEILGIKGRSSVDEIINTQVFMISTSESKPLYDYLLKSLSQKWMAGFGHEDIYEDIKNGEPTARPASLVPIQTLGMNLVNYQNNQAGSLFSGMLKTPAALNDTFKPLIVADFENTAAVRDLVLKKAQSSTSINKASYLTNQTLTIEPFSRGVFDSIESSRVQFDQATGGFFKLH